MLVAALLLLAACGAPTAPTAPLDGLNGESVLALAAGLGHGQGATPTRLRAALGEAGLSMLPADTRPAIVGLLPHSDEDAFGETILLVARADPADLLPAAGLLHLASRLCANGAWSRRSVAFALVPPGATAEGALCAVRDAAGGGHPAVALAVGPPGPTRGLSLVEAGASPELTALLGSLSGPESTIRVEHAAPADSLVGPLLDRAVPSLHCALGEAGAASAPAVEARLRLLGTLALGLADHPGPLRDPLALPRALSREGPRVALDDLVRAEDGSLRIARTHRHAERLDEGLTLLVVNVPEGIDATEAWKTFEDLEARADPVPYLLVRSSADVERAVAEGRMGLLPRRCCAHLASQDPGRLRDLAAQGYRWLAPWTSGGEPLVHNEGVEPVVAALARLPVLLDASGLAPELHARLRRALGPRPAVLVVTGPLQGPALGPDTLPVLRLRQRAPIQWALQAVPGLAPPVLHVPRSDRLIQAIASWGSTQPAGWEEPGSPGRTALRAALGGRLLEWLRRAEAGR